MLDYNKPTGEHQSIIDLLNIKQPEIPIFSSVDFRRVRQSLGQNCSQMVDYHLKFKTRMCHLHINRSNISEEILFLVPGTIVHVKKNAELGILLYIHHESHRFVLWFPTLPKIFRHEINQRLVPVKQFLIQYNLHIDPQVQLRVSRPRFEDESIMFSYAIIDTDSNWLENELSSYTAFENRCYRKSDWFLAQNPSAIWNYLINGHLYDPCTNAKDKKRFICQQCAYSWWSYFGYLYKQTRKNVYDIFQDEIAYSVLLDIKDNGEWGHGLWSEEIETHSRFHLDGIHLLTSQFEKKGELFWLSAAERCFGFVQANLVEQLDDGSLWFLHDTIEDTRPHKFSSTLFGKSPGNSFCLNTHVQALTVLYRLQLFSTDRQIYQGMFSRGILALQRILEYRPQEYLYIFLLPWVLKSRTNISNYSIWRDLRKGLWKFFPRILYCIARKKYPRLIFSNGFTERDLTLTWGCDNYHIVNIKDLLTLYQQYPLECLRPVIEQGVEFIRTLDLNLALKRSLLYIEWIDILFIYNELIRTVPQEELERVEAIIRENTSGYSLDYFASELVRTREL